VAPLAVSGIVLAGIATAFVLPRGRELMARVSTRKVASTRQAAKAPIPSPAVIGDSAQSLVNAAIPSSASSEPMTAAVETAGGAGKADSTSTPRGYARLTLDVASYFDEERAAAERDRLAAASGLQGWVVGVTEGGIASHHVLLGIFRVRERAETMAATIWNRGLVTKALVVPLPPRRSRH
jgi:hypothetical protein